MQPVVRTHPSITEYESNDLAVTLFNDIISEEKQILLCDLLVPFFDTTRKGRSSMIFGDEGTIYKVTYLGKTSSRTVTPWSSAPLLEKLRDYIKNLLDTNLTVCAVQLYPDGNSFIKPHRDKEMIKGTVICGVSLGQERTISFSREGHLPVNIPLPTGSMYVMLPPTNDKWLHSIPKDYTVNPRISLTFRNYK